MSSSDPSPRGGASAARALHDLTHPPPAALGRYTLCHELGAGGMATVYLARVEGAAGFEKLVALKTIHKHLAQEQTFIEMFLDEARIASRINHPNVCQVFDFGDEAGTYYMAMEYLVGEPLIRIINTIVDDRREDELAALPYFAARMVADACEGLHAAHELRADGGQSLGIVHRDVSPQNLFITYDGSVKVVDFGCAKAVQRVSQTDTGILKGKVSYASPEQIRVDDVDRRADVWALGVCLWECLTLSHLFRRDTNIRTAMAVLEDEIPYAAEGRAWVPDGLARIANRALSRDRATRYATARELGKDLRRWIAGSGTSIEAAELGEWMDRLFPGERERHHTLMDQARRAPKPVAQQADVLGSAPSMPAIDSVPEQAYSPEVSEVSAVARPSLRLTEEDHRDRPRARKQKRSGGPPTWLMIIAVLGAVAAGGYWAWLDGHMDPWLPPGARSPSVVAPDDPEPTPSDPVEPAPEPEIEPEVEPEPEAEVATEETAEETATTMAQTGRSGRRGRGDGPVTTVGFGRGSPAAMTTAMATSAMSDAVEEAIPTTGAVRVLAAGGWAEVYEGSRHLGRTPLTVNLSPGSHTLRLLPLGQEPGTNHQVRVHGGTEVTLRVGIREPAPRPELPPAPTPDPDPAPDPAPDPPPDPG